MAPLATVADYEALYGVSGAPSRVDTALSYASTTVRAAAGGRALDAAANVVETLDGDGGVLLWLADYPVTAVASVTVGGAPLASAGYEWSADGRLRHLSGSWTRGVRNIVVTYSHAAAARVDLAKGIVLAAAHRAVTDMAADPEGTFVAQSAVALTADERASLGTLVMV